MNMTTPQLIWNLIWLAIFAAAIYLVIRTWRDPQFRMYLGTFLKRRQGQKADTAYVNAKVQIAAVQRRLKKFNDDMAKLERNMRLANEKNDTDRVRAIAAEMLRRKTAAEGDVKLEARLMNQLSKISGARDDIKADLATFEAERKAMQVQHSGNQALADIYRATAGLDSTSGDTLIQSARTRFQEQQDEVNVLFELAEEARTQQNLDHPDLYATDADSQLDAIIAQTLAGDKTKPDTM